MEAYVFATESDVRKWIKEAVKDGLNDIISTYKLEKPVKNKLLGRKEVASLFGISLVTLKDWMDRGLPYHKQRRRVYFLESEVWDFVKDNKRTKYKPI